MAYEVVITDHTFDSLEIEREVFNKAEVEINLVDGEDTDKPIRELVTDVDGVLVMYEEITTDIMDQIPNCKVISRTGIGVDNVDVQAATERGIYVTNVTDYCIDEVSNHTLGLLFALQRKIAFYNNQTKNGEWDVSAGKPMHRLSEQSIGLVAFGKIAREVCRKAATFGMEILAWDPYLDNDTIEEGGATPVDDFESLISQTDIVSVHTPLTPETEGLFSEEEFRMMKNSAIILNVARGGIINENDLAKALEAGEISGAGIDVLEEEPPVQSHPLMGRGDVILTPHAAWNSVESVQELREKAAINVRSTLEGEVPPYLFNEAVLE